jgi:POT family proton-dependent oligopeptide transporter
VGIVIMGFGFLFMRFASSEYELMGHSSMYWLVLAYLFHTVGELCASPVSLSYITKLAPEKYASLIMGVFWAASGLGNKLAATIGENAQAAGEKETFTGIFIFCTLFAFLIIAILKPLKRLSHGAEDLINKTI